jgi:RNA polymerase sigma-70 factor, ECF subfamily
LPVIDVRPQVDHCRTRHEARELPVMPSDQGQFLSHFMACQHDLRAFLAGALRRWDAIDDVMQELSVLLWARFDQYDPKRPFAAWARGIAKNLVLREYERSSRAHRHLDAESLDALDLAFAESDGHADTLDRQREVLRHCLSELATRARRLLSLRYDEDCSLEVVAERSGLQLEAVRKALTRARRQLLDCCQQRLAHDVQS